MDPHVKAVYEVSSGQIAEETNAVALRTTRERLKSAALASVVVLASTGVSDASHAEAAPSRFSKEAYTAFEERRAAGHTSGRFSSEAIEARMRGESTDVAKTLPTPDEVRQAVQQAHRGHVPGEGASRMERSLHEAIRNVEAMTGANIEGFMRSYTGTGSDTVVNLVGQTPYQEVAVSQLNPEKLVIQEGFIADAAAAGWHRHQIAAVHNLAGWSVNLNGLEAGDTITLLSDTRRIETDPLNMIHSLSVVRDDVSVFTAVQYENEFGGASYYDPVDGSPIRDHVFDQHPVRPADTDSVYVSSPFGQRVHPVTGLHSMHNGIDLAAPTGTPVVAAADGHVKTIGHGANAGNYVVIEHDSGLMSLYMHLHTTAGDLRVGDRLKQGDYLGDVGSTGRSTGSHLHFETRLPVGTNDGGEVRYSPVDVGNAPFNDAQLSPHVQDAFAERSDRLLAAQGLMVMPDSDQIVTTTFMNNDLASAAPRHAHAARVFDTPPPSWQMLSRSSEPDTRVAHAQKTSLHEPR